MSLPLSQAGVASAAMPRRLARVVPALALIAGLLALVAGANENAARPLALVLIGIAIGATLLLTNFGFAAAFRRAAEQGDYTTFRGHALMLALGSVLMVPFIEAGNAFGAPVTGFVTPIGLSLVGGAFLFGLGMRMAGGCASGTLFLLGGGNLKFLLTLATFVLGSTIGAAHVGFWRGLPTLPPVTLSSFGDWRVALAVEVLAFAAAWRWLPSKAALPRHIVVGAVLLAGLNFATLLVAGRPWSETSGFALWGSKLAATVGFRPETWAFWEDGSALQAGVFADKTSIMDFAIVLGAFLAAGVSRRFELRAGGDGRAWISAGVGGLAMGYGARLADGCNIGAYFSSIVSGSFSGYVWALSALAGSALAGGWRRAR